MDKDLPRWQRYLVYIQSRLDGISEKEAYHYLFGTPDHSAATDESISAEDNPTSNPYKDPFAEFYSADDVKSIKDEDELEDELEETPVLESEPVRNGPKSPDYSPEKSPVKQHIIDGRYIGKISGKFGAAIYGNIQGYSPELYYGRISQNAAIQLLDDQLYLSEFNILSVKIAVLKDSSTQRIEAGSAVWVALTETDFPRSEKRGKTNYIDLHQLEKTSKKLRPNFLNELGYYPARIKYKAFEKPMYAATREYPIGHVTNRYGGAIYPDHEGKKGHRMKSVTQGDRLLLLGTEVRYNQFNIPVINVEVLDGHYINTKGYRGWVSLTITNFVDHYNPWEHRLARFHPPKRQG